MLNYIRSMMNSESILGFFFQTVPVCLMAGIVYVIVRAIVHRKRKDRIEWGKEIIYLIFVCYLTGLISLVILPANFWLHFFDGVLYGRWEEMLPIFQFGWFNLVPSLIKAARGELVIGSWIKTMLIGNVLLFLPFGFFLPFVTRKVNGRNIFLVATEVPLCAELLQLVFGRNFDVDDLICNFAGIVMGYFIGAMVRRIGRSKVVA